MTTPNAGTTWRQHAGHWLRREWRFVLGLLLGALCLILAVRDVSSASVSATLTDLSWEWAVLALGCVLLASLAKAARWRALFYPQPIRLARAWSIFLVGQMLNVVLPTRVGEVGRIYLVGEAEQISKMSVLSTVLAEKVSDMIMLLLALIGLALWPAREAIGFPAWLQKSALGLALTAALGLSILLVCVYHGARLGWLGRRPLRLLPAPARERMSEWARSAWEGFEALRHWRVSVQVWGWSLLVWCLATLSHYFVFLALGLSLSLYAALFLLVVIMVGVAVPTPGKLGVFHYLCILTLSLFAIDRDTALSYGVLMHLIAFAPITLLGLGFFWKENWQLASSGRDSMKNCPLTALESMWFYELVAARLEVTRRDRVLDIGCGSGYACLKFAEQARHVIGVDISAPLINHLTTFDRPDNLEFLLHDVCTEAFGAQYRNYFSRVCSSDVLEHVADPARFAGAISKVLAEDGRAVLTFPNLQDHGRHHFDTPAEVEALFAGAGLAADVRAIKASSIYGFVWGIYSLARLFYKRVTGQKPDSAYKPSEDVFHHYSLFEQMTHPQWYHGVARRVMLALMAVSKLGPLYTEIDVEPNGNIRGYRLLVTATKGQGHARK